MLKQLPDKCILLFSDVNCKQCRAVEHFLEEIHLPLPLIVLNEETGKTLANRFSICAVPVLLVINEGSEYERFYGTSGLNELIEVCEEVKVKD